MIKLSVGKQLKKKGDSRGETTKIFFKKGSQNACSSHLTTEDQLPLENDT